MRAAIWCNRSDAVSTELDRCVWSDRLFDHRGDFYQLHAYKLEDTRERLEESREYIQRIVSHWKDHPALDSWSLTNEASQRPAPHPLALVRYRDWLKKKYGSIDRLNTAWSTHCKDFNHVEPHESWDDLGYWNCVAPFVDWRAFWREHLAWWLHWIAREVRSVDASHPVHAHVAGQLSNLATHSIDLPAWNPFADSLGGTYPEIRLPRYGPSHPTYRAGGGTIN